MGGSLLLSEINFVNEGAGELREDFLMDPIVLKRIASGKYTMYELANLCFQWNIPIFAFGWGPYICDVN